jgi:predicted AAA+ superfamily ATPase
MERLKYLNDITEQFEVHDVCAILGPRQVGKTTLAKQYVNNYYKDDHVHFDLENPVDLAKLENPLLTFSNNKKSIIVIDEIQLRADLFPILRVLVDQKVGYKFLILGSASRDLIQQSSETLAGRIGYIELPPFTLGETADSQKMLLRGGFPKSYLALDQTKSYLWRKNYITTFLERDIPNLGFNIPAANLRRFWLMLTHYHGQTVNYSEIARSLMISDNTVRRYIDILAGTFMIRVLQPWFENIAKRQVKSPKLYIRDIGILNALIGLENKEMFENNPRLGAFWEGFALEQLLSFFDADADNAFFWSTQAEAELDLLIFKEGKRLGFEFKYTDAPRTTKSMHSSLNDLKLDHLYVIYPGQQSYQLTENISVTTLDDIFKKFSH